MKPTPAPSAPLPFLDTNHLRLWVSASFPHSPIDAFKQQKLIFIYICTTPSILLGLPPSFLTANIYYLLFCARQLCSGAGVPPSASLVELLAWWAGLTQAHPYCQQAWGKSTDGGFISYINML